MNHLRTGEQIYAALDQLVTELAAGPDVRLAEVLRHRLHGVAWSSRSELFDEIESVIEHALGAEGGLKPGPQKRLREILDALHRLTL